MRARCSRVRVWRLCPGSTVPGATGPPAPAASSEPPSGPHRPKLCACRRAARKGASASLAKATPVEMQVSTTYDDEKL